MQHVQLDKWMKLLVVAGVIIILICMVDMMRNIFPQPSTKGTIVDTTKLNTINDSILFYKNEVIVYQDSLYNEIKKADYISNDSAIELFKRLIKE